MEIVGSPVYYMGGATQAYAFKLISNMVGMTNLAVLSEGMRLCEKLVLKVIYSKNYWQKQEQIQLSFI